MWSFILSFVIIAAAELGDKTQMLTLGFAAKYPVWEVLSAVFCATAVLTAIAVGCGNIIDKIIPVHYLQIAAGVLFILIGIWTIWGGAIKEEESKLKIKNPFWIIFISFFIAELGDKTQLAVLTLSVKYQNPIQVWLGATLGMFAVNVVAAFAGGLISKYVSQKTIGIISGIIFIGFGIITLLRI